VRVKKILATSLVLLHLLSVSVFLWTDFPRDSAPGEHAALRLYLNLSGSFRDYTYFAPSVASDMKAAFLVEDAGGRARLVNFTSANKEADFRYSCIINACMRQPWGRDLFAQSWAAALLGSEPEAERVTVIVGRHDLPTMEDYRRGRRPQWLTIYAGEFARRALPSEASAP
jgi:hypothetical protein